MKIISSRNVNEALLLAWQALDAEGVVRDSRNGPVTVFKDPVTTIYERPTERVLFYPERDCNPFFHFMESLWMMAGRNDVEWITRYNSSFAQFSDDGVTFHGAYGARWRKFPIFSGTPSAEYLDQLETIANLLKQNKDDRRIVLQMWDAELDLGMEGKDFPCNLIVTFRINPDNRLDMTVFNRSNDMIWGAYGANAVHFSVLQEVMAAWIGVPVGRYWQISTNFHGYHSTMEKHAKVKRNCPGHDPYSLGEVMPFQIVNGPIEEWFQDLEMFMSQGPVLGFRDIFFKKVVVPIWMSWDCYKNNDYSTRERFETALLHANSIGASDWRRACVEWLKRRIK